MVGAAVTSARRGKKEGQHATPDAPLLRVARDPRDAREVSGCTGSTFPLLIGSQRLVVQLRFHPATAWREAE